MAQADNSGKLWLGLSTTTEIAMAITLNKYSTILPDSAVLIIWLVPLAFLIVWVMKEEKSKAFTRHFQETPISYCIMAILFIASLVFATPVVKAKMFVTAKVAKTETAAPAPHSVPQPLPYSPTILPLPARALPAPRMPSGQRGAKPRYVPLTPNPQPIPPLVIGGNVDQSGDGCQQKVINGSNNTNNCTPPVKDIHIV